MVRSVLLLGDEWQRGMVPEMPPPQPRGGSASIGFGEAAALGVDAVASADPGPVGANSLSGTSADFELAAADATVVFADAGGDLAMPGAPGAKVAVGCGGGALATASAGAGAPGKEASTTAGIFADFALASAEAVAASTDACGNSARLAAPGVTAGCGGTLAAVFVDGFGDGERAVDGDPATPDAADWVTASAEPALALPFFPAPLKNPQLASCP